VQPAKRRPAISHHSPRVISRNRPAQGAKIRLGEDLELTESEIRDMVTSRAADRVRKSAFDDRAADAGRLPGRTAEGFQGTAWY